MKSILLAVTILVASGGAMATPLDAATATKTYEAIPYGSGPDGGYSFDGCTTFNTPFSNRGCKFDGPGTDGYLTKPTTLRADGLHPVLHWNSFDYLALSYMSNSSDIFVAAYDASTDLFVQGWKFAGARYISEITWDDDNVSFIGQSDLTVNVAWDEIRIAAVPAPAPATLVLLGLGLAGLAFRRRQAA